MRIGWEERAGSGGRREAEMCGQGSKLRVDRPRVTLRTAQRRRHSANRLPLPSSFAPAPIAIIVSTTSLPTLMLASACRVYVSFAHDSVAFAARLSLFPFFRFASDASASGESSRRERPLEFRCGACSWASWSSASAGRPPCCQASIAGTRTATMVTFGPILRFDFRG